MPILPGLCPIESNGPRRSSNPSSGASSLCESNPSTAVSSAMDLSEELYLRFFDAARSSDHASTDVVVLNPLDVLNRLNPHSHEDRQLISQLADALNGLGRASARAQGLRMPITSYKRFMDSDHRLYLLVASTKPSSPEQRSTLPPACHQLVGLLKVGHKKLYLNNASGHLHECHPLCVLDFYVSESSQRKGYGRQLFEHMLRGEGVVDPCELAYDRPSPKMVAFLQRHYALVEGLPQPNNYMVFSRPSQEVPDALAPSVKSVGNLQLPTPHSPRSAVCAQKLPPLLPTTLPSVATAKLPDLRRTHSSASSGSSWHHPSTPSSASSSSMGELARACLHWPSSPTSPWHAATAESASAAAPSAECAKADATPIPLSPHLPVDSSTQRSRPSATSSIEPLVAFRASTRSHAHPTTRLALGTMGNQHHHGSAAYGGDRSVASVAAALKARGAILPHLSVSSVVGRR